MNAPKGAATKDVSGGGVAIPLRDADGRANVLTVMPDAALQRKANLLLSANLDSMTYREKRATADAYQRVKAEIERRAALSEQQS